MNEGPSMTYRAAWRTVILFSSLITLVAPAASAQAPAKRPVNVNDLFRLRTVRDVQVSPDGDWVAFVVGTLDSARDRSNSDLYMVSWDGSRTVQLTFTPDGESSPRWSPDGRYLSFVASRGESRTGGQIWLLDRAGGEAQKLTDLKAGVSDYQWSPDSKRIVIVAQDPDSAAQAGGDSARSRTPKPIVIDRYQFKQDGQGYLGNRRSHLYLFDVATKKAEQLTSGRHNENNPSWSPDGRLLAFVSERAPDPDRVNDANVYVMEARVDAEPKQLTTWPGPDGGRPTWSPDGKRVAYLQGSEPQYSAYSLNQLAVVGVDGGTAQILTAALDRPVSQPEWTSDGGAIVGLVTDDRVVYPARIRISDGAVERLLDGRRVISDVAISSNGRLAVLAGSANQPNEIYALESGALRATAVAALKKLAQENDAAATELAIALLKEKHVELPGEEELKPLTAEDRRRSPRVLLEIPVMVIWTDAKGEHHTERATTRIVNAYGAMIFLKNAMVVDMELEIHNVVTLGKITARVVWVGDPAPDGGQEIGVELGDPDPDFWVGKTSDEASSFRFG